MTIAHSQLFRYLVISAVFIVMCLLSSIYANSANLDSALDRVNHQVSIYPQEKIHVVTDRDLYCGGDTIWLRVFLVDAESHLLTSASKYAYVELLNPFGFTNKRIKLIERDGVYAGYLPIDEDIYEGDYTLSAFSAYAENQGKDYFFRKNIRILTPYSSKYIIESKFNPIGDEEVNGNFKIRSKIGENLNYNIMSWTMPDGKFLEMPDSRNGITRKFSRKKNENVVLVKFGDYGKYVHIEYPQSKIDISFYPEGGWLIADELCPVAFKATDCDGKGFEASGVIRDENGEEIVRFSTSHRGMGIVTFVPEEGHSYSAEYIGSDGMTYKTEIGSPKIGAAALRYRSSGTKSTFCVAGGNGKDLHLIVAHRGAGLLDVPISENTPLSINQSIMPSGVFQAMLYSPKDSIVLSERLFFVGADRRLQKTTQLKEDSLAIAMKAPISSECDCTIRIIDTDRVTDCPDSDIVAQLLLQSELRGRIENPSYYFENVDRETDTNLDILMMVNGWSRYNLPDAILGKFENPTFPLEIGQEISGTVRSRWKNKPLEGVMVCAIIPNKKFGTFADTDENGVFYLNGFDFPENTPFIFKAMNEKGGLEGNYEIDEDHFPTSDILSHHFTQEVTEDNDAYFKGSNWIMLDEIKVQAFKNAVSDIYESFASYSKTALEMENSGATSIEQALRGVAGMSNFMGHLRWRNNEVAYYIDGTLYDPRGLASAIYNIAGQPYDRRIANYNPATMYGPTLSEVEGAVPFHVIERIDFIRPEHSLVIGPTYGGAVVSITTKTGEKVNWSRQFELKDYMPLGYQEYKEYASPILSADEYDLKNYPTVLWLPSVKFNDSGKDIELKVPLKSNYKIIVEGLSDNGDIISESI